MTTAATPYEDYQPGQLIEAERMNTMQVKIKEDIQSKIDAAKQEIKTTGVDKAGNADKFENKTGTDWTKDLDQRYAPKVHDHEGQAVYKRYFRRLKAGQTIVLEHKLGRFPLVDLYQLCEIDPRPPEPPTKSSEHRIPQPFYLYYHHEELDRDRLYTEDRGMVRWPWGTPIEQMLAEYGVEWEDDDTLGDVVNDFLSAFFKPPAVDHMEHKFSPWIDDHRKETVGDLKRRDEWSDIRWVVRPQRLTSEFPPQGNASPPEEAPPPVEPIVVEHLNYDTLAVQAADVAYTYPPIDLMILLRS